ncbi:MAG: BspA family leucine-rich repeat surface protein, partial [Bacteroides sp.]
MLLLFSFASYGEGRPFITRWKGEAGKELRIPIDGGGYKLVIKRATDGSVLVTKNDCYNTYSYTPTEDGELLVEAEPERVRSIWMCEGSAEALLRVEQFGTVQWQTMEFAFCGCKNMQFAEGIDTPNLSHVTDMSGMFYGCTSFNQPLNNWDVSHVINMRSMFYGCTSFNQPLNNWDLSQVTNMNEMFSGCTAFNQPLNNWDVSKVTHMGGMFSGCTTFNQDLGMWKLESCELLSLDNCGMSVENYSKSLEGWAVQANIKQGLNLSARGLKYNTSSKAARAKLISEKRWRFDGDMDEDAKPFITRWKGEAGKELRIPIVGDGYRLIIKRASDGSVLVTENNLDNYHSYYRYYSYTPTENGELLVEAGPERVWSIRMWDGYGQKELGSCEALLRVEQFGTAQWKTMRDAFRGCINLQFAAGIDTPDLIQVSDMSGMFAGCTAFNQPLNSWNVSNVQRMGRTSDNSDRALGMFQDCSSFNQPLDNWDVSKVEGMGDMFAGCISFDQDLGMWKLERCEKLTLNLCGMSVENYSNSLVGWAAQPNIREGLHLDAEGLSYNETGKTARANLKTYKHWTITGDEKASHSIAFVPNRLTLNPAEEKVLVLKKTEIEDQEEVTLTSSDPSTVQIIDAAFFKIKGLKLGKATVTARIAPSATHGELIAKCEVSVRVVVTGVSLSQTELTLEKGAKATLVATVVPADATNKNVSWHSDNAAIATVEDGVVTAVSEGQTSVHVFTEDGNITTECKVIVKKNGGSNPSVTVTGVKLSQNKLTLKKDDSFTLVATVEPNNASNKAVTWSSDNTAVATVSDAGLVEAKAVGVAVITVTTQEGAFTATCEVTVTEEDVVLTGLRLSPSETRLKVGGEATLSVTYEPAG